jgi:hypothetical protein
MIAPELDLRRPKVKPLIGIGWPRLMHLALTLLACALIIPELGARALTITLVRLPPPIGGGG